MKCHGICSRQFFRSSSLTRHVQNHKEDKPYQCGVCNKTFSQSYTLSRHILIHKGDNPYMQEISSSSKLDKHMVIHSNKKKYKCDVCEKQFVQLGSLVYHKLN